jgi:tetratricopeptide (TPR) repeat protein
LLDEGEKTLFSRLAVFHGGRSLEAIEAVCGPGLPIDVLDGLASLVDKSLVQQRETADGEPRFVMLETIHAFAQECLVARDEAVIQQRCAAYFVDLAEEAEPELRLVDQERWARLLELELHNLRAVLEWSLGEGDVIAGLRLAGALHLFWWAYGYHIEGRHWTERLLERLAEGPPLVQAKFLLCAGLIAALYDQQDSKDIFHRLLSISRDFADQSLTGWALTYLAMHGDGAEALAAAQEGLVVFRQLDHLPGIAQALNNIGLVAIRMGDFERAEGSFNTCLEICQQTGDARLTCLAYQNLAFVALRQNAYGPALDLGRRALLLAQRMKNPLIMTMSLTPIAGAQLFSGQARRAACLLGASESALEAMCALHQPVDQPEVDRIIAGALALLDGASFEAAWVEGRALTLDEAVALALAD